jgi:hypothetical protein
MLYFYNLSDEASANLFAPSHKAMVFENIASGASASRAINAVAIGLVVKSGDSEIGTTGDVDLKRQVGSSVFPDRQKRKLSGFLGSKQGYAITA